MTDYKDRVSGCATDIDWSKAPEGATHWGPENSAYVESWYKKCDGEWMFATYGSSWQWGYLEDGMEREREIELIQRPAPPWSGDGLPPVGASVVLDDSEHGVFDDYRAMIGVPVVVTAAFKSPTGVDMIACALPGGLCGCFRAEMARPTKTPAQIAAEEREATIEQILSDYEYTVGTCTHALARSQAARIYDAGYRKIKGDDR